MSFKRFYAFEAEGVSEEVKKQLEAVEKTADEKCDTPEACDKVLDKIDTQAEKFNDALSAMAGAAKDCKDGKCSSDDMAVRITPAQAELKEVAKTIGVASEADGVTEEELKDVKDYLEGAKEIVEAKKDELGSDGGDSKSDDGEKKDDKGCEGGECEGSEGSEGCCGKADEADVTIDDIIAVEAYDMTADEVDYALEAYMDALDEIGSGAMTMAAMEGANMDAIGIVRNYMKEAKAAKSAMKAAAKSKDYKTAAAKARECAGYASKMESALGSIPPSVGSTVIVTLALALVALTATGVTGNLVGKAGNALKGTKMYGKAAGKVAEAKKAAGNTIGSAADGARLQAGVAGDKIANSKVGQAAAGAKAAIGDAGKKIAESKAGQAISGAGSKIAGSKVGQAAASAKTAIGEAAGNAKAAVGDAATKAAPKAAKAGKIIAIGTGGVGVAAGAGGSIMSALKKVKAVDGDGNPTGGKLDANDFNVLIGAMKLGAAGVRKHYEKLAADYEKMASSGETATEAELIDMFYAEPAVEGETAGITPDSFDGFVTACESLLIGGGSAKAESDNSPFLFGE